MNKDPEFLAFLFSNVLIVIFGGLLALLSYYSYLRKRKDSKFRRATFGFLLITFGGTLEFLYEGGVKGGYHVSRRELLILQAVEGTLIAIGLALLLYSIQQRSSSRISSRN